MEELHVEQLLKEFNGAGFEIGERVILGHFGTVQTLLSLIWNTPIRVDLIHQKKDSDRVMRRVHLMAGDRNVCTAVSAIPTQGNRDAVIADILTGQLGLGQIIAEHTLQTHRELLFIGRDSSGFWRTYHIVGPDLVMEINEYFPRAPYEEIGWLGAWRRSGTKGRRI